MKRHIEPLAPELEAGLRERLAAKLIEIVSFFAAVRLT
jgi:hypothetical protein